MVAESSIGFVVGGDVAENQNRLVVEGNPGGFEYRPTFVFDHFAADRIAGIAAITPFPAREGGLGLFAFDRMNDELAVRIPGQDKGFGAESQTLHAVPIEGTN